MGLGIWLNAEPVGLPVAAPRDMQIFLVAP